MPQSPNPQPQQRSRTGQMYTPPAESGGKEFLQAAASNFDPRSYAQLLKSAYDDPMGTAKQVALSPLHMVGGLVTNPAQTLGGLTGGVASGEMIAWLPHPGGGHIPVRIPHPHVWPGAAGVEEAAGAAAGAPLAAQAPMSPIEQFYATNPSARMGGGTYGVAEGRTTGTFKEGAGGLNSLLPAGQRPVTPRPPIQVMDPYQSAFMGGPPVAEAAPAGSGTRKFLAQQVRERELALERQQMSRGQR